MTDLFIVLTMVYTQVRAFHYVHNTCGFLNVNYTSIKLSNEKPDLQSRFLLVSLVVWGAAKIFQTRTGVTPSS